MHTTAPRRDTAGTLAVRFKRTWNSYMTGDCATFPANMAVNLVARGLAERVNILTGPNVRAPEGAELALRAPGPMVTK
jgi:hypothetical protein